MKYFKISSAAMLLTSIQWTWKSW